MLDPESIIQHRSSSNVKEDIRKPDPVVAPSLVPINVARREELVRVAVRAIFAAQSGIRVVKSSWSHLKICLEILRARLT